MRYIFITTLLVLNINSAMITGSQDKLSISGASMNVTSGGVTKTVNSGQITFTSQGNAPTDARELTPNDLNDITNELSMTNDKKLVNLKFAPVKHIIAKKIKRFLMKAGIVRGKIKFNKKGAKASLYVKQININQIKDIYPLYHKAVNQYYAKNNKKLKKKAKTPTVKVTLTMMKKYHKSIFKKYRK